MRVVLAQLAPQKGRVVENLARVEAVVDPGKSDLYVFPELFLSGYRVGDAVHRLALSPGGRAEEKLTKTARTSGAAIVVGAARIAGPRSGEVENGALLVRPDGELSWQAKRYLPTFGPFEEGIHFSPADHSTPVPLGRERLGLLVCYDTFFPEVARELALGGATLLVVVSASPVTSRRLFQKLLPARAVENALPVVFANRVGVEDGVVFGGESGAWDARGEPLAAERLPLSSGTPEEALLRVEIDVASAPRWRPFRPVLRDIAARPSRGSVLS